MIASVAAPSLLPLGSMLVEVGVRDVVFRGLRRPVP